MLKTRPSNIGQIIILMYIQSNTLKDLHAVLTIVLGSS